jgi:hypothetical protein
MSLPDNQLEQPTCQFCGALLTDSDICQECYKLGCEPDPDVAWKEREDRAEDPIKPFLQQLDDLEGK